MKKPVKQALLLSMGQKESGKRKEVVGAFLWAICEGMLSWSCYHLKCYFLNEKPITQHMVLQGHYKDYVWHLRHLCDFHRKIMYAQLFFPWGSGRWMTAPFQSLPLFNSHPHFLMQKSSWNYFKIRWQYQYYSPYFEQLNLQNVHIKF